MKKNITIPMEEYQRLLMTEDLSHRQRFTIHKLECDLESQKAASSLFARKTLDLLMHSGYSMEDLLIYYKGEKHADID